MSALGAPCIIASSQTFGWRKAAAVVARDDVIVFLDEYLNASQISDHIVNGLQFCGRAEVNRVALGVSASLQLFQAAAAAQADMLIVHHGLFWNNTPRPIKSVMKERLRVLFDSDMTLLGYHLPLDCHAEVGNNAQLARRLELAVESTDFGLHNGLHIGLIATLPTPLTARQFLRRTATALGVNPMAVGQGPRKIRRVAIISGGAASHLSEAIERDCDAFLSGEIGESSQALALEGGICCIAVGHYNSEKYGLLALSEVIQSHFAVKTQFIDIPNPY